MTPEQIAELEALVAKADGKFYSVEKILDADRTLNRFLREHLPAILAALKAQQPGDDVSVMERVAELQLASFLAGRGSVKSMKYGTRWAERAPSMDEFRRMATAAMQESRDD